jgi:murein L,D-transpeptidase YcbB/YkuD
MKTKYTQFLKNVFLSSITALIPSKSNATSYNLSKLESNIDVTNISSKKKADITPKLRIKFMDDNIYLVMAHASHSSHVSHASHSAHSSHYSSSPSGGSGTSSDYNYTPSKSNNNSGYTNTDNKKTVYEWNLGDRLLKKGMKGTDVKELIDILIQKGYFKKNDSENSDYNEFTLEVENSVKNFQKVNSIKADGIVGSTTVFYLKK